MIQSVDRAVRILLELQGARHLGLTEMASRLGLANSTVHGILQTLVARGMVEQDRAGRYMLGAGVLRLGNVFLDSNELRLHALSWADSLAERTGFAVRVGVPLATDAVVVLHVLRPDGTPQMSETGIAIPAHASALGRAMLAFHPKARRLLDGEDPLPRLTGRTIADRGALDAALEVIRAESVASGQDEVVIGESELAAPVFDARGEVVGAVSVVVATPEWPVEDAVVTAVRETAIAVSRSLGSPRWPALMESDQRAG